MQVFKLYFKIIQKNLPQLLIYVIVFISLAILFTISGPQIPNTAFTETKINIAFFNEDKDNVLVDGLKEYLSKTAFIVDIKDDPQEIQDALFFRKIEYIIRIPTGFTKSFFEGRGVNIEKTTVPDSTTAIYTDMLINKYLDTAGLYLKGLGVTDSTKITEIPEGLTGTQFKNLIINSLDIETPVELKTLDKKSNNADNIVYYFNYFAYTLLAVIILGVSTCMIVLNTPDLRKRNLCAPVSIRSWNIQLLLGNLIFALISWLLTLMIIFGVILYGNTTFTKNVYYLCLNSFIFTLTCLSISFAIGNLLRNKNAQAAVTNVLTMGMCFIGGVFVPQEMLGQTVLSFAGFTPTYWFVKANHEIISISNINAESLIPIYNYMIIQLGFAAVILIFTLIILRQRRRNSN